MITYLLGTAVFLFSIICYFILLKFSTNLGIRKNHEGQIRFSAEQKPALGGVVFYVAFILSVLCYAVFSPLIETIHLIVIVIAVTLSFLIGLADDAFNTIPSLKLIGQLACAIILILGGFYINIFELNGLNYILTILWIIGMMNSINMLDNMDGTASASSLLIALVLFLIGYIHGDNLSLIMYINIGFIAVLLAFLFYNWHPSKMYMGDSGSMLLGLVLAILGIQLLWNPSDIYENSFNTKRILMVLAVFIVPISDTFSVVVNRLRRKTSPFVGGKDHTTHHLNYLGVPVKMIPLVLIFLSLIGGFLALSILQTQTWTGFTILLYLVLIFSLLFVIYSFTFSKKK